MNHRLIYFLFLVCGLLLPPSMFAQTRLGGFSHGREIRYPTEFEVEPPQIGRDGRGGTVVLTPPTVIPKNFTTRTVGSRLASKINGVVRSVVPRGKSAPVVTLQFYRGPKLQTTEGRKVILNGRVYRADGFDGRQYVLKPVGGGRELRFRRP